ncbi:MAG: hypothetical protein H6672_21460, partial [Anaerolineaceae bacterium]|nr:hypothetical protein [Anaerolineaceae bacterium]
MKPHTIILWVLVCLLLRGVNFIGSVEVAQAQDTLTPIYSGPNLTNFYWSPDSSVLVFQDATYGTGVELNEADYFSFDVASQTLSRSTIWPFQPTLSVLEEQIYQPYYYPTGAVDSANENTYMFLSPDQRYMVYQADPANPVLAIADRQAVAAKLFDVLAGRTLETQYFFALWSANSQSVVVGNNPILGDFPRYFYISDFTSDIQEATIQEIFLDVTVDGHEYAGGYIEDVSQDGKTLLMSPLDLISISPGVRGRVYLGAFTFSDPPEFTVYENTSVREQDIMSVAFDPDDERYLLALTADGIQRYNTITDTWMLVNAAITATWANDAQFSPDGRY